MDIAGCKEMARLNIRYPQCWSKAAKGGVAVIILANSIIYVSGEASYASALKMMIAQSPSSTETSATESFSTNTEETPLTGETIQQNNNVDDDLLDEKIKEALDRTFSTNMLLLNTFIGALAALTAILAIVSIFAGLYFFYLRKSVEDEAKRSILEEVFKKIKPDYFQEQLTIIKSRMEGEADDMKSSINEFKSTLNTLVSEFDKLQLTKKINAYVVDLPPGSVDFQTKMIVTELLKDALKLLDTESLVLTPSDYINLGNTFTFSGEHRKALEMYENAARQQPNDSAIYTYIGRSYYYLNELDRALEACQSALRCNPLNPRAWNVKGTIWGRMAEISRNEEERNQKLLEKEYKCYMKALEIDKNFFLPWYNLACHFSLKNEFDKSFDNLEKAIRLNPKIIIAQAQNDPDLINLKTNNRQRFTHMVFVDNNRDMENEPDF